MTKESAIKLMGISVLELNMIDILLRLILSLLLGILAAYVYKKTTKVLYLKHETSMAILVIPMIVAMVLMVIDNSLSRAFGLVGALAIIRFRTPVKSIKDILYLFLSMAIGISCGVGHFKIAIAGTTIIVFFLRLFSNHKIFDLNISNDFLLKILLKKDDRNFEIIQVQIMDFLKSDNIAFKVAEINSTSSNYYQLIYLIKSQSDLVLSNLTTKLGSIPEIDDFSLVLHQNENVF